MLKQKSLQFWGYPIFDPQPGDSGNRCGRPEAARATALEQDHLLREGGRMRLGISRPPVAWWGSAVGYKASIW